jgi:hypothetical protein
LQTDYQLQYVSNIVGERTAGVGAPSHLGSSAVDLLSGRGVKNGGAIIVDGGGVVVGSNSSCQLNDRSHVTGASSSSSSGPGYPQETLNPPPGNRYTISLHGRSVQWSISTNLHLPHHVALTTLKNRIHKWLITVHLHLRLYPIWAQELRVLAGGNNRHRHQRLGADYHSDSYPPPPTPARSHYVSDALLHVHRHLRQNDHILTNHHFNLPHHLSRFRCSMFYFFSPRKLTRIWDMQLIWTKLYSYFNRVNNFLTRRQSCALDFLFRSSLSAWVAVTRRVIYENIYYYHVSLLIECKMMRIIWYDWHLISLICFPPGIWFLSQIRENTAADFLLCQPLICCITLNNTLW